MPSSASAVAARVRLSLTGSTFCAIDIKVSNRVLNSVVTCETSITCELDTRADAGLDGLRKATYLLPNTVLALISAVTLAGISSMYFGATSRDSFALVVSSCWIARTAATRPISTRCRSLFLPPRAP